MWLLPGLWSGARGGSFKDTDNTPASALGRGWQCLLCDNTVFKGQVELPCQDTRASRMRAIPELELWDNGASLRGPCVWVLGGPGQQGLFSH